MVLRIMKINKIKLQFQVWCIHCLQRLRILPNIWYKCEIDLGKIKGKELSKFFKEK